MLNISINKETTARNKEIDRVKEDLKLIEYFPIIENPIKEPPSITITKYDLKEVQGAREIVPYPDQQLCLDALHRGESCIVFGEAGSGKSTILGKFLDSVIKTLPPLGMESEQYYLDNGVMATHSKYIKGMPGFAGCAYTIRATSVVANSIAPVLHYTYTYRLSDGSIVKGEETLTASDMCSTLHTLAGYKPNKTSEDIEETEEEKELRDKSRFKASRNLENPQDPNLRLLVIDEASFANMITLGVEVIGSVMNSFTQVIIVGDLSQIQAVGGLSILQVASYVLPYYILTGSRRSSGVLLDFVQSFRDNNLPDFFLRRNPDACDSNGKLKPSKKAITFSDSNNNKVMFLTMTYREQTNPELSEENIAKIISAWVIQGMFTLGVHMLEIPQRTGAFGSERIVELINSKLDDHYKKATYYFHCATSKPNKDNHTVIAAGDVIQIDREPHMILGVYPNPLYAGDTPTASFMKRSRNSTLWLEIATAHINKEENSLMLEEINSLEEDVLEEINNVALQEENANKVLAMMEEATSDYDVAKSLDQMGKVSHQLLLMDYGQLLVQCKLMYDESTAYDVQIDIVKAVEQLAMYHDTLDCYEIGSVQHMLTLQESISNVAEAYNIPNIRRCMSIYNGKKPLDEHGKFAITAYQAQGSETPIAVVTVHPKLMQAKNEVVYTMISRARKLCIVMCPLSYLNGTHPKISIGDRSIKGTTIKEKLAVTKLKIEKDLNIGDEELKQAVDLFRVLKQDNDRKPKIEGKMWWEGLGG